MSQRTSPRPGLFRSMASGLALCGLLALASTAAVAQVGPDESAAQVRPADGLEATLWAHEPMVVNPTNMDIDSRGRIWITEGLNYRLHREKNAEFDRLDEADRIKILEDTDGDGRADKMTVFAGGIFPIPMGLAVEELYRPDGSYKGCRVYVGNSPDLLVLEDTDGDDRADTRTALLTGFGGVDSDHGVHGMVLGPDGKLYFTHGDGCCSVQPDRKTEKIQNFDVVDRGGRHVWSDQLANTLRVNRDGTHFESLADRQRNDYETSLNSFGNIFTSDNDDDGNRGCRVIWVMDGGAYGYRTPGSPRHWGEDVPGNVPKLVGTGNGSPCGITVYEGDLLPDEYRGGVLEADAGTRQINFFPISREGAAFRTQYKVMLSSADPWFRPVDMTAAPDGSVFVADWYDAGVGGHGFRDQTTGRIYRVAPKGSKTKNPKYDFSTVEGLIAALKSPVIATQDAARRSLIALGDAAKPAVSELFMNGAPIHRARALWTWHAIDGDPIAMFALTDKDPRIREQAIRILGRDVSRNAQVEYEKGATETPLAASKHLDILNAMAGDPDAGVRRELILAVRDLPTEQVGDALRTLVQGWDGQDRWYLEALGLALDGREDSYIASLFDGNLFGDLGLPDSGKPTLRLALPPYFPVDRNEAFIASGEPSLPANPLSKTLGLAWRVHRYEVLPLLGRVLPDLNSPDLQQAADDVLLQIADPRAAAVLADLAGKSTDPVRKRQLLATLARKLGGDWSAARDDAAVVRTVEAALADRDLRPQGIALAAATGGPRHGAMLLKLVGDASAGDDARSAAVEALGRLKPKGADEAIEAAIEAAKGRTGPNPVAEAAVRTLPQIIGPRADDRLIDLLKAQDFPLMLRREALRTLAQDNRGVNRLLNLFEQGQFPDDLKTEVTTTLYSYPSKAVRARAAEILPPIKTASGRELPPISDLLNAQGDPERGRLVFLKGEANACSSCHRVQGQGHWIGPDLSTIGTKYGKDELLRSILNPSAAIGYNYMTQVVALADGRVVTGLLASQTTDGLVLKTAEGRSVAVAASEIEDRKQSELSLMPEGLAQTMGEQDLVDLLAFLGTLREPVSIVGVYEAIGPVADIGALTTPRGVSATAPVPGPDGKPLSWRRLTANAEGQVDPSGLLGDDPSQSVLLRTPIVSPVAQEARLVLDTSADVEAWIDGSVVSIPAASPGQAREARVRLPKGRSDLLIRLPGGPAAPLVTTLVAPQPLEFSASEAAKVSSR